MAPKLSNKPWLSIILFLIFSVNHGQTPIFPGAYGAGAYYHGSPFSNPTVLHVTSLADGTKNDIGTLRWALQHPDNKPLDRIIVFDVSGVIDLQNYILCSNGPGEEGGYTGAIYLAGQTAPEGGITVTGGAINLSEVNNTVVRYMKFRNSGGYSGSLHVRGLNTIVDHVSISHVAYGSTATSMAAQQNSPILTKGTFSNNLLGQNGYSFILGRTNPVGDNALEDGSFSVIRNAYYNCGHRAPFKGGSAIKVDVVNNIVHGWGKRTIRMDGYPYKLNHFENYYQTGGNTTNKRLWCSYLNNDNPPEIYTNNNFLEDSSNGDYEKPAGYDNDESVAWTQFYADSNNSTYVPLPSSYFINSPHPTLGRAFTVYPNADIKSDILPQVGACKYIDNNGVAVFSRDIYDTEYVDGITNDSNSYRDTTLQLPVITQSNTRPNSFYGTNPHIPSAWLSANGYSNTTNIHNQVEPNGYTVFENYINQVDASIPDVSATGVTITPEIATLNVPETLNLTKNFIPSNTTDQSGVWTSSDPSIATVNQSGLVTSVSEGVATITFASNDGNFTDTSEITVTNIVIDLTGIDVTPNTMTIDINQTEQLSVEFFPTNATDTTGVWSSSDSSIVSVDADGNISGLADGNASITFTSNDGNFSDTSIVSVIDVMFGTYEFYDATTDAVIQNITEDNTSFNLDIIGDQINLRCLPPGGDDNSSVESIEINWTGIENGTRLENEAPYMGMASQNGSDILPYTVVPGTYDFVINYYDQNNADGELLSTDTFSLTFFTDAVLTANAGEDQSICEGESITLTATGGSNYLWSTGETTASIDVSPTTTTTYTVTVSNTNGDEDSDDVTVFVNAIPIANAGEDQTICQGETVTLTASGGTSYLWSTGETSSSIEVSPTSDMTYSVEAFESGCSSIDEVAVFVNTGPTLTISGDVTIIEGESTVLSVEGANTFLWSTGDTSSSITVSPSETTVYTVVGSDGNCDSDEAQVTVTVNQVFQADAGENQRVCENDDYAVTLSANQGDSYLWNTGETTQSITVSPLSTTQYTVTVTSGNVSDDDTVTVFVDPNPNVNIVNGNNVDILTGDFITLTATGANTYEWNNGATQPNIAVSPSQTTTYEVRGYINDCYDEKQVTVNVYQEVQASAGEDVTICLDDSVVLTASGGDEYLWSTGETTQSIEVSPEITTDYFVTVFNPMDFDEAAVRVEVDTECDLQPTEPQDETLGFGMDFYPNPADRFVDIDIHGTFDTSRVEVYDITGKLVISKKVQNDNAYSSVSKRINISKLQEGIYVLRLIDENRNISKKLIVN